MASGIGSVIPFSFSAILLVQTVWQFRAGRQYGRGYDVRRADRPFAFWLFFALNLAVAAILAVVGALIVWVASLST